MFALQGFHIAIAAQEIAVKTFKDVHSNSAVEGSNIAAGLVGPLDSKRHLFERKVFQAQAELGQNLFVGDTFPAVLPGAKPLSGPALVLLLP